MPSHPPRTILSILNDAGRNFTPIAIATLLIGGKLTINFVSDTAEISRDPENERQEELGLLCDLHFLASKPDIDSVGFPELVPTHEARVRSAIAQAQALERLLREVRASQVDAAVDPDPQELLLNCQQGVDALVTTLHCCFFPDHAQATAAGWNKFAADITAHAPAIQDCLTLLDGLDRPTGKLVRETIAAEHLSNPLCLVPASTGA